MQMMLKDGTVLVTGIIPKDAEYKTVGDKNSSLTKFSVKVGERPPAQQGQKPEAIWANVCCWHSVARATANLKKLDTVLVVGKLETYQFTAKDGTQKQGKQINAELVLCMPNEPKPTYDNAANSQQQLGIGNLSDYEEIMTDDGLPF